MKLAFSWQTFEKYSDIKFNKNPLQWEQSCPMQMDRHGKANSHFSQVGEWAKNYACAWKFCVELGSTVSSLNFSQLHNSSL